MSTSIYSGEGRKSQHQWLRIFFLRPILFRAKWDQLDRELPFFDTLDTRRIIRFAQKSHTPSDNLDFFFSYLRIYVVPCCPFCCAKKSCFFDGGDGWDSCCPVVVGVLLGWADSDRNIDRCCLFFLPLPPYLGSPYHAGGAYGFILAFSACYDTTTAARVGME